MKRFFLLSTFVLSLVVFAVTNTVGQNEYVVAKDGSGDFKSINEAVAACKAFQDQRVVLRLKPGVYEEKVEVFSWITRLSIIGEKPLTTKIVYNDYSGKGDINTFTSWTFKVTSNDFRASNITFENNAGPVGQAVAIHLEADRCSFVNCRFVGNQDTMYLGGEKSRYFFDDCYIEGTTDFIFGAGTAVFRNCNVLSKKNSYVTAASTVEGREFGFVFMNCNLTANDQATRVYLGRPWRNYAKTVFLNCTLGQHIVPEGWHNWSKPEAEKTAFYAEYRSNGPGAAPGSRVSWSHQLNDAEASRYTISNILAGDDQWNPLLLK